jgi:membrane protease YdiL (CAAX protease family)
MIRGIGNKLNIIAAKNPVIFGMIAALMISVIFLIIDIKVMDSKWAGSNATLVDSLIRFIFFIPAVLCLGLLFQQNGLKYAFSVIGLKKGLMASQAVFACMAVNLLAFIGAGTISNTYAAAIPVMILQQIGTGLFEETTYRGLFMGGMFRKWSRTAKGRITMSIISGVTFGLAHLANVLTGQSFSSVLWNVLYASILGIGFAAIYLYSRSLLTVMLMHAFYDIVIHLKSGLIVEYNAGDFFWTVMNIGIFSTYFVYVLIAAFILCLKAEPFEEASDAAGNDEAFESNYKIS